MDTPKFNPNNPLASYYPRWHANCVESARWLRSPEYEEFFARRGWAGMLTPEQREAKAREYEAKAAQYLDPNYTGA